MRVGTRDTDTLRVTGMFFSPFSYYTPTNDYLILNRSHKWPL